MNIFYQDWIPHLLSITEKAAFAINGIYKHDSYKIESKLDSSPITEADLQAHQIIKEGLFALDPTLPLLSEEGEAVSFKIRSTWNKFWLVDPLDGTKGFIEKTGEFTINIALIENHIPVIGVIGVPQLGHYYWAVRGEGAYMRDGSNKKRLHTRLHSPLRVVISRRSYKEPEIQSWGTRLDPYELVYCGSSLKICWVANGEADLYPQMGRTCEWDTAAGQCILEAAGGQLINLKGEPLQYNTRSSLKNPPFYALVNGYLASLLCG